MTSLYPLRLKPLYKQYVWGGRRLATVLGRPLPPQGVFAESWDVCDHGAEQSLVEVGPLAQTPLNVLVADRGQELLGRHHPQARFPLLMKYLDANQPLSVQVHPNDALAARMGLADPGKTEAWCILQADPGSTLWAGFNRSVDRDTLEEAIRDGQLDRYLHRLEPKAGDCIFLPAGTVHALGAGILVAEIQQSSDNTFRLYDWNRVGADGKPRPLHVDQGLEALDFQQGPVEPSQPQPTDRPEVERLVRCDPFILDRARLTSPIPMGGATAATSSPCSKARFPSRATQTPGPWPWDRRSCCRRRWDPCFLVRSAMNRWCCWMRIFLRAASLLLPYNPWQRHNGNWGCGPNSFPGLTL